MIVTGPRGLCHYRLDPLYRDMALTVHARSKWLICVSSLRAGFRSVLDNIRISKPLMLHCAFLCLATGPRSVKRPPHTMRNSLK